MSVISAGLANYLELYEEDMSNVRPASFAVKGYNGAKSYMPILYTKIRLGARGGEERHMPLKLCILDTNAYKLLIGVDLLNQLDFILDGGQRRLHLQRMGVRFSLPVVDRNYAFKAKAVREYHQALNTIPPESN